MKGDRDTKTVSHTDKYIRDNVCDMIWEKNTVTFPFRDDSCVRFRAEKKSSGASVGESSMSSSSIMCRCSSDEESLSCPSSMATPVGEKKPGLEIDLSGPGLRSRSQGPPDLRPRPDLRFSGHPDLRPYLVWGLSKTPGFLTRKSQCPLLSRQVQQRQKVFA